MNPKYYKSIIRVPADILLSKLEGISDIVISEITNHNKFSLELLNNN